MIENPVLVRFFPVLLYPSTQNLSARAMDQLIIRLTMTEFAECLFENLLRQQFAARLGDL